MQNHKLIHDNNNLIMIVDNIGYKLCELKDMRNINQQVIDTAYSMIKSNYQPTDKFTGAGI